MKYAVAVAMLAAFLLLIPVAFAQQKAETNSATEQVWAREQEYWRIVKNHNAKAWADLWSEDFIGWPRLKEHPIGKDEVIADGKSGLVVTYDLHRESVEMHGDAVITFYRAEWRSRGADGSVTTHAARLSHTWMRRGGRWVIVGGMSAADTPPVSQRK